MCMKYDIYDITKLQVCNISVIILWIPVTYVSLLCYFHVNCAMCTHDMNLYDVQEDHLFRTQVRVYSTVNILSNLYFQGISLLIWLTVIHLLLYLIKLSMSVNKYLHGMTPSCLVMYIWNTLIKCMFDFWVISWT